ncbi:MAG: tryptophan 2,3-dioxygenase family protein [Chloroflexota bacterium]
MPLTYSRYLKIRELLALQQPRSDEPEHDEMLFIIIHQTYELWFKQVLHEIDYAKDLLEQNDTPRLLHTLKRVLTILKTLVGQVDILETMTPLEFLSFRDYLESASGFQSFQFRELEFVLGYKRESRVRHYPGESLGRARLENRYVQDTLWDSFLHFLVREGYGVPADQLARDVTQPVLANEAVQLILIDIYRHNPLLADVCERLVDLDEGIQEWCYRHVKMVERTIGNKKGTGGSSGVEYLQNSLGQPLFPDLWAIRTRL